MTGRGFNCRRNDVSSLTFTTPNANLLHDDGSKHNSVWDIYGAITVSGDVAPEYGRSLLSKFGLEKCQNVVSEIQLQNILVFKIYSLAFLSTLQT